MADVQFKDPYTYERRGKGSGMSSWLIRHGVASEHLANAVLVLFSVFCFTLSGALLYFSTPHIGPPPPSASASSVKP